MKKINGEKMKHFQIYLEIHRRKYGFNSEKFLTPQQALELITPQQAGAIKWTISKFSYQKFEKVKIFNSRIW